MRMSECQNYEVECEVLGRLCEELGLDCSNCYDKADLISLIKTDNEELKDDHAQLLEEKKILVGALEFVVERENFAFAECSIAEEIFSKCKSALDRIQQIEGEK